MRLRDRNYIAYLGALTLLFSYAEMFLPRTVPFFRLGLGNTVVLLAFGLDFPAFLVLLLIKAVASSLMAGTLFSPFFILSLAQSVASGVVMYGLFYGTRRIQKFISLYGISMVGAVASALVQILLASLYLGSGSYALLGPMMLFSLFASILTAFLALHLHIPNQAPVILESSEKQESHSPYKIWGIIAAICVMAVFTLMQSNLMVLGICLVVSLLCQKISGRRILLTPHITLWIFVLVANILSPSGRVVYSLGQFNLTEGSLVNGLCQALKLSAVSALSQCAASLRPSGDSLVAMSLRYFRGLSDVLRKSPGNIFKKIRLALAATQIED